ncbi:uncharacterized protein LOC124534372 isoform X2 [Vanessa cardui]|nr:uncharacterized protein LOC124534372 isoform X2 [Vanessa cardui]
MTYIVFFYFISSTTLRIIDFAYHYQKLTNILAIFLYLTKVIVYTIATLLEIQLMALSGAVLVTLKMINDKLEKLNVSAPSTDEPVPDITRKTPRAAWNERNAAKNYTSTHKTNENDLDFDASESSTSFQIRQIAKYYLKICEFVRQTTKSEEYIMIVLLIYHTLHLKFKILKWVSNVGTGNLFSLIVPSIRSIIHSMALILSVEFFHQTHVQMERTFLTINLLKCQNSGDKEVCNELDLFFRLHLLNKTSYSPLAICTLARPLVVKIFGGMVTYVVFVMT